MKNIPKIYPRWNLFLFLLVALLIFSIIALIAYQYSPFDLSLFSIGFTSFAIVALLGIFLYPSQNQLTQKIQQTPYKPKQKQKQKQKVITKTSLKETVNLRSEITQFMRNNYGTFWYKKVSIQLLVGKSSAVDKLAPHLSQEIWQESNGTVLIYAGDVATGIDEELIHTLQQLRRRRPLDGVIWVTENTVSSHLLDPALSFNHLNAALTDMAARVFHNLFNALKWRAPVWFWSVSDNTSLQASEAPSVVYLTEPGMRAEALSPTL
ncbi:hypothetical protein OOA_02707, partial [Providencia burhodogranariea DSM 19968]